MEYVISGTVVYGDEFELMQGYVAIKDGIISEIGTGKVESVAEGIIIPAFVNAHTHIGDSIEKDVPFMTLDELVGPGGLKHRILKETAYNDLVDSMRLAISDMISCGTALFADFRESGVMGVEALREAVSGSPIDVSIFGRQLKSGNSTLDELLLKADGLGISSVVEHDHEYLCEIVEKARREGKQVAIHAGEKDRLDIKGAIDIKPDHIVHMTNASDRDIRHVADSKIPVVVCVRSNFVTGVGMPPVRKMIEEGLTVGVGTDNFMLNSPNIFSECEFMAKVFLHDDRKVLKISTLNGAKVLKRDGEIGSISEGKVADIIVIDDRSRNMVGVRNPIAGVVRRARPDDIKAVIHKGNLVENSEEKHGS